MILLRIFVAIYGGLTLLALFEEIKTTGFIPYQLVYFVCGLALLAYAYKPNWLLLLYLGLGGLIVLAIYLGLSQNILNWTHILVRTIISIAIIYFHYQLI